VSVTLFISYQATAMGQGEWLESNIFEDVTEPCDEQTLQDLEKVVKDFLYGERAEEMGCAVTILFWKRLGS